VLVESATKAISGAPRTKRPGRAALVFRAAAFVDRKNLPPLPLTAGTVVHWLLSIGCCLLYIAYCLLSIAYCLLYIAYYPATAIGYCLLSIGCCLCQSFGYWLLSIGYCLLSIVYCLLSIAYCLLSSYGYWLLSVVYWLLSIGYCPAARVLPYPVAAESYVYFSTFLFFDLDVIS
jgi:hypothetical protein